jgi:hypothetical protein
MTSPAARSSESDAERRASAAAPTSRSMDSLKKFQKEEGGGGGVGGAVSGLLSGLKEAAKEK